jgi:hypothetical protein
MEQRIGSGALRTRRRAVPVDAVDDVLRLLHLDLLGKGASARVLGDWLWGTHWFPHLRYTNEIMALAEALPASWRTGRMCDPQIVLQFPHVGPEPDITFHIDQEPEWAGASRYVRIVGIALSPWREENGGLRVETRDGVVPVDLEAGDAVLMTPDLPHSAGLNRTGAIRYGVYFRWLEELPA